MFKAAMVEVGEAQKSNVPVFGIGCTRRLINAAEHHPGGDVFREAGAVMDCVELP